MSAAKGWPTHKAQERYRRLLMRRGWSGPHAMAYSLMRAECRMWRYMYRWRAGLPTVGELYPVDTVIPEEATR